MDGVDEVDLVDSVDEVDLIGPRPLCPLRPRCPQNLWRDAGALVSECERFPDHHHVGLEIAVPIGSVGLGDELRRPRAYLDIREVGQGVGIINGGETDLFTGSDLEKDIYAGPRKDAVLHPPVGLLFSERS
jgi:hypothetical protein